MCEGTTSRNGGEISGRVIGGVGFAAAGNGGRIRHRCWCAARHVYRQGDSRIARSCCQRVTASAAERGR